MIKLIIREKVYDFNTLNECAYFLGIDSDLARRWMERGVSKYGKLLGIEEIYIDNSEDRVGVINKKIILEMNDGNKHTFYTQKDCAEFLGVEYKTFNKWIERGLSRNAKDMGLSKIKFSF
ncbi:MAG: hypothetical protein IJ086_00010 [Clostridium sp.]|nr:hypothetical protein [Clostridium sp.]